MSMDLPENIDDIDLNDDGAQSIPGFSVPEYVRQILPWYARLVGKPGKVAPAWQGGGMRITTTLPNTCSASLIVELTGELKVLYSCSWDYAPSVESFGLASKNTLHDALGRLSQILDQYARTPKL